MKRFSLTMALVCVAWIVALRGDVPALAGDDPAPAVVTVLEATGGLEAPVSAAVAPAFAGRVAEVTVRTGDNVQKGQVLARLESAIYELDVRRAQAAMEIAKVRLEALMRGARPEEVESAQAEVKAVEAALEAAEAGRARAEAMFQKGALARRELDEADRACDEAKLRLAQARAKVDALRQGPPPEQVAVAKAEIAMAETDLQKAQLLLSFCTIRAPISGTVTSTYVHPGEFVNPAGSDSATAVCELVDLGSLEAVALVSPEDYARVAVGQKCQVRLDALPDQAYQGVVGRIGAFVGTDNSIRVHVAIRAPEGDTSRRPLPGMPTRVRFGPAGR